MPLGESVVISFTVMSQTQVKSCTTWTGRWCRWGMTLRSSDGTVLCPTCKSPLVVDGGPHGWPDCIANIKRRGPWRYVVNGAEVVLAQSGFFAAVGDRGNYAYAWRCFGDGDFRVAFCDFAKDPGYILRKLSPHKEYDGPKTLRAVKTRILEVRRARDISSDIAREEWDLLRHHSDLDNSFFFAQWMADTRLDYTEDLARQEHDSDAVAFCQEILPRIVAAIQADLESSKS